eukprot:TRINITY_DN4454_c0_g1_i1.p1 TRINITY_DN4454_c0_g1~~TRINITY_DN4454_c0_g1_i1.p1  ORF type:complete len:100 (+),score=16.17 TRINITY_DN4454_c0_g1_i1:74-373(+)
MIGAKAEKCATCGKTVYATERIAADGNVYHKGCFKCLHCNGTLTLSNFAAMEGKTYCKPHFKQLFKLEGKYSFASKSDSSPALETNTVLPPAEDVAESS